MLILKNPRQQSGQRYACDVYKAIKKVQAAGNTISIVWLPGSAENELLKIAEKARQATQRETTLQKLERGMRSTVLRNAWAKRAAEASLPEKVGKYSKRVDAALPGKHTRQLYDGLSRKEASVLAQLRTGMAKLNGYLHRIDATPSDQCACGQARETVEHFLFRCTQWTQQRAELLRCTDTRRSNISFYLGGKSPSDDNNWAPNMGAVRATIRFAIATGRLDAERPQGGTP